MMSTFLESMIKAISAGPQGLHAQFVGIATTALQAELASKDQKIRDLERRIAALEARNR